MSLIALVFTICYKHKYLFILFFYLSYVRKTMKFLLNYICTMKFIDYQEALASFSAIFKSVLEFLQEKDPNLNPNLNNSNTIFCYLTDIFGTLNRVNLLLQGVEDALNQVTCQNTS